jgi:hypothetical protein
MTKNGRSWTLNHALRVLGEVHVGRRGRVCREDCAEVERILEEADLRDIGTSNPLAADEAWYRQHLKSEEARKKQSGLPSGMHYADASIDGREEDLDKYGLEDDEEAEYLG